MGREMGRHQMHLPLQTVQLCSNVVAVQLELPQLLSGTARDSHVQQSLPNLEQLTVPLSDGMHTHVLVNHTVF